MTRLRHFNFHMREFVVNLFSGTSLKVERNADVGCQELLSGAENLIVPKVVCRKLFHKLRSFYGAPACGV